MRIWLVGVVVLIVAAAGTSGYAGSSKRSITGVPLEYTKWRSISADRVLVKVNELGPVRKARERLRDKEMIQQEIWAGGAKVIIRHIPSRTYGAATTKFVSKSSSLKKRVHRYYSKKGLEVGFGDSRRVIEKGERSGWVLESSAGGKACLFGVTGFLSDAGKTNVSGEERYDTVVWLQDCSGNRSIDVAAAFMESLEVVERAEEKP